MKSKMKHAISLIVLVVTILVLAILAAVVIISLSNANIMSQASRSVFKQDMANYKETYEVYVTNRFANDSSFDRTELFATYESDKALFTEIFGEVEEKYQKGLMIIEGKLVYNTEDENEQKIVEELIMVKEPISKYKSYVGCYADIDGNGTIDGIIFADLAVGVKGKWDEERDDGYYSYEAVANKDILKDYVIEDKMLEDDFGKRKVIKLMEGQEGTEDRFYVMALDDIKNDGTTDGVFAWYAGARKKGISDYRKKTSTDFDTGKTNTETMLSMWNDGGYGDINADAQDDDKDKYLDMWGVIKTKVEEGWFVPSKDEWSAFIVNLNIHEVSDIQTYRLSSWYWSSSLAISNRAWVAGLITDHQQTGLIDLRYAIRLATKF